MVKLYKNGIYLVGGTEIVPEEEAESFFSTRGEKPDRDAARGETIAYDILKSHNQSDSMEKLRLKFDAMASHDITFVGIIQTAKASGMDHFPPTAHRELWQLVMAYGIGNFSRPLARAVWMMPT